MWPGSDSRAVQPSQRSSTPLAAKLVQFLARRRLHSPGMKSVDFCYDVPLGFRVPPCLRRKDRHKSFTEVMFYGNELSLFMMQVLVFTAIDMRVRNAAFSGSITYLVMCTLGYLRREWGENNLSQKSMVDKKFLI